MDNSKIGNFLVKQLNNISQAAAKATAKVASGKRIETASDDAAGLAVVQGLEAETRIQNRARLNADDGVGIANIADSTLSTVSNITTRQTELAAQAANGTYSDEQRKALNDEYQQLEQEKQRQLQSAEFNGTKIFGGDGTVLQVGSKGDEASRITLPGVDSGNLSAGVADISSMDSAQKALDDLSQKQSNVSQLQGQIGAARNRVDYAANAASNSALESANAASRIRDVDMAEAVTNYTKQNILQNVSTAMLAQANQNASVVQSLLK